MTPNALYQATLAMVATAHPGETYEQIAPRVERLIKEKAVTFDGNGKAVIALPDVALRIAPALFADAAGDSDAAKVARAMAREARSGGNASTGPSDADREKLAAELANLPPLGPGYTADARLRRAAQREAIFRRLGHDDRGAE